MKTFAKAVFLLFSMSATFAQEEYRWEGWDLLTDLPSDLVRVGIDHYPPFTVLTPDGQPGGFSIELLQTVLAAVGREAKFIPGVHTSLEEDLQAGRLQVLPLMARGEEPSSRFDFTVPYIKLPGIVVVRGNEDKIQGFTDLKDKKVLVMAGDTAEHYLRRHPITDRVFTTETLGEALQELASGIGDVVVAQQLAAQKWIDEHDLGLKKIGKPILDYQELCFAVRNGDKKLLGLLNEGLSIAFADGTVEKLRKKWLSTSFDDSPKQVLRIGFLAAMAILLLLGVAWSWKSSVRQVVKGRVLDLTDANRQLVQETLEHRHTEEALRRYASEMADLYEKAPVGYHSLDAEGIFVRINDTELGWLGYAREELLWRKRFQDLLTPESALAFQREFPKFKECGYVKDLEFEMVRKDGNLLVVLLSATVVRGETGAYLMSRSTVYDITERRSTEITLRQREADLKESQRLARVGSWEWDPTTDVLHWSDERYRIARVDPTALPPPTFQTLEELYVPESSSQLMLLMRKALQTGEAFEVELETLHPDGSTGWVHVRGEAKRGPHGMIVGLHGTAQDITDRKRVEVELLRHREHLESLVAERTTALQESELRYRTVADFTADWETWRGEDGHYRYVSPATERITGYPASAFLEDASLFGRIVYPEDRPQVVQHLREQRNHLTPITMEFRIIRGDGQLAWIEHICRPVYDDAGNYAGSRASNRDITERKRAEEALREADQRKDQFLAILGHELRNPLAPIRNAAELLHQGTALSQDQVRWAADLLGRQVSHISRLVDDLLDVSRITRGKVQLQRVPVDLSEIVTRAIEQTRSLFEESKHRLETFLPARPLTVEADPVRMAQVIGNLLTNSGKYTDPGGTIWLSLSEEEGEAAVHVRDTGMGIPADLLTRVFDVFVQAEQGLDRARGGLGLGLTLAKSLVEMHGGRIEARSPGRGRGSTFSVYLPLWRTHVATPVAVASTAAPVNRRTILVVDDNTDVAESFALLLEISGHEVHVVYNGESALTACTQFHPEIVFLDIGLPGIDGYETARRLRQTEAGKAAYLVAVTGYGQEEDISDALAAGFDAHLLKPVVPEALEECLAR
ncbi:polar amino acid transport system substrate-binding protein [Gammaproteobacteria bacterium]